jgi:hypothetical protein
MSDLLFQNILNSVQSNQQPAPVTFTAAATIAPSTYVSFIRVLPRSQRLHLR